MKVFILKNVDTKEVKELKATWDLKLKNCYEFSGIDGIWEVLKIK